MAAADTAAIKAVEAVQKAFRATAVPRMVNKATDKDPQTRPSTVARRLDKVLTELKKESAELTPRQKRYATYLGGSMAALPLLGLAAGKIRTGKWLGGAPLKRWLPEQALHGAFWGSMPIATEELMRRLPDKTASAPGQDLRLPITGGMKFPTDDSKSFAKKNLEEAQGKAEVGPAPLMEKLKPKGPTVQDIAAKPSNSTAGSLPKIGSVMLHDPLIKFLREDHLKKVAAQVENNLKDSVKDAPQEKKEDPGDGQDPTPPPKLETEGVNPHRQYLEKIFSNKSGIRKRYDQREAPATPGQVDKVLK